MLRFVPIAALSMALGLVSMPVFAAEGTTLGGGEKSQMKGGGNKDSGGMDKSGDSGSASSTSSSGTSGAAKPSGTTLGGDQKDNTGK